MEKNKCFKKWILNFNVEEILILDQEINNPNSFMDL
jgi:hypothetical protein